MDISIPGYDNKTFTDLVLDYNGTLAVDGVVKEGVLERLKKLSEVLKIHVVTGDTHGNVKKQLAGYPCNIHIISKSNQTIEKKEYLNNLNSNETIAIGNGRNDSEMLKKAGLGIALLQEEGLFCKTLLSADVVYKEITNVLDALLKENRLKATLRD